MMAAAAHFTVKPGLLTDPRLKTLLLTFRKSSAGQLGLGNDFDFWQPTVVKQICRGPDAEQPIVQRSEDAELYDPPAWRVCQVSAGFNHTVAVIETAAE